MDKRLYKIVPSRSVFVDCDDTLIHWPVPGSGDTFELRDDKITMDLFGTPLHVIPMEDNINTLKQFYQRGYEIVVWSLSSKQWAEQVVERLGLKDYVDFCVSKPDFYIDDRPVEHFMLPEKRLYAPPRKP